MAYTIGSFAFNQSNVNKILAVASMIYAALMCIMTESFMGHYFSAKSLNQSPDMLSFFARNMSIMMAAGGVSSWVGNASFGVSFFNLIGQSLFLCHFLGLLICGLYEESLYVEQKQMWRIQVAINLLFVILAYLGFKDATCNGLADSDRTHTEAATSHKRIGSFPLHQSNCNKFLGVCWLIYGIVSCFAAEKFYLQYFTAKAIDFALFMFWARGVALLFLAAGVSSFIHCGSDGISLFNLIAMVFFFFHFVGALFVGLYDEKLWIEHKTMWQLQTFVSFIFVVVAYLGNKDANERKNATTYTANATTYTAPVAAPAPASVPPGAGSML